MTKIPFNGDVNENETILKFAFNIYSICKNINHILNHICIEKAKIEPYMDNVIYTCMKVLVDEKCDEIEDSFKYEVGKFVKNIVM